MKRLHLEFIPRRHVFHPDAGDTSWVPETIYLTLPDGTSVALARAEARALVSRLWDAEDVRGAVPLAAAIATELESSLTFARPVSLDANEAAAYRTLARL